GAGERGQRRVHERRIVRTRFEGRAQGRPKPARRRPGAYGRPHARVASAPSLLDPAEEQLAPDAAAAEPGIDPMIEGGQRRPAALLDEQALPDEPPARVQRAEREAASLPYQLSQLPVPLGGVLTAPPCVAAERLLVVGAEHLHGDGLGARHRATERAASDPIANA